MYFFCFQIITVINKIEKNTQRDLNFIFYEISEYVNFFCLKMFPFQKIAVSEHQFRESEVACECCQEKLWGFTLVAIIQYMFLLQLQLLKSQNYDVHFSNTFTLEIRLPTSPIRVINYFQILCCNTDMAKTSITWMTIIRVMKSTL